MPSAATRMRGIYDSCPKPLSPSARRSVAQGSFKASKKAAKRRARRRTRSRALCSPRCEKKQCSGLATAASAALLSIQLLTGPAYPSAAFELEQLTEATEDFQKRVEDKLQSFTLPAPNKEPENIFNRLLQPKTQGDKRKKEEVAKEREYKQREKEEKDKQDKIKKEQERIKRERDKLFRQQALLGGSALGLGALFIGKWQAIAAGAAILFRTLGGPTIMSNVLRTPGLLFGRSLRVVEWDVAKSPHLPDGRVVSFKLRALTPVGLRQAIVRNCGLSDGREVKQMCHWIQCGPGFCEPLNSVPAFRMLADPSWIVWSRKPRKGLDAIPYRLDEHEIAMLEQNPFGNLMPEQELELQLRTINAAAALSRGEPLPDIQRHGLGRGPIAGTFNRAEPEPEVAEPSVSNGSVLDRTNGALARENGSQGPRSRNGAAFEKSSSFAADSTAQQSYCEEFEKGVNQAAIARIRSMERRNAPADGGDSAAAADESPVSAVTRPVQQISQNIGEAVADPVAATRDALGVPSQDCQPSATDVYRGNVPGPSTGGQGAEFRETPAQLDRYQAAAKAMEELLRRSRISGNISEISQAEEERLIALAVTTATEESMRHLFRVYASDNVVGYIRFSRALLSDN